MSNSKQTSKSVATKASEILRDNRYSKTSKSVDLLKQKLIARKSEITFRTPLHLNKEAGNGLNYQGIGNVILTLYSYGN